jgi:hypothetical protein
MLLDNQEMFSSAQAVTTIGSTPSTNVIDLGVARDIGGAVTDHHYLLCQVVTAFTSGGSATLQVQVQGSNDNATWSTIAQSDAIAVASLTAGYKFLQNLFPSVPSTTLFRYYRINYVVGTAAMTAGNITATVTPGLSHAPTYQNAYLA